eukprot:Em0001g3579a
MGAMWVVVAAARGAAREVLVGALVSILVPVVGLVLVAAVLLLLLLVAAGEALLLAVGAVGPCIVKWAHGILISVPYLLCHYTPTIEVYWNGLKSFCTELFFPVHPYVGQKHVSQPVAFLQLWQIGTGSTPTDSASAQNYWLVILAVELVACDPSSRTSGL